MTLQKILTALCNKFITGLAIYGISMSLAYAGYIGQDYDSNYDWCDPRFCCPPGEFLQTLPGVTNEN